MSEEKNTEKKQEVKAKSKEVWVDLMLSPNLVGREEAAILKSKIEALTKEIEAIIPAGRISISVSTEKEKFYQFEKVFSNLIKSRAIYNERGFMRDPELGSEFAEISGHIKSINNIVDKRRKKWGGRK